MNKNEWQAVFGAPSASFEKRIDETFSRIREGKKVKKISVRVVILAAVILLLMTGVVYAAVTGQWDIRDYFKNMHGTHIPEDFTSDYDQTITLTAGNVELTVCDAFVDGPVVYLLTEARTKDGTPGYFVTADMDEHDEIGQFYHDQSKQNDKRTILQAAQERAANVYSISVSTRFDGLESGSTSCDFWYEGEDQFVVMMEECLNEAAQMPVQGTIRLSVDEGDKTTENTADVTFPIVSVKQRTISINQSIEGLPVIVDSLTIEYGRMSNFYTLDWHYDRSLSADNEKRDIWFELLDEEKNGLPHGALSEAGLTSQDGIHYTQKYMSTPSDLKIDRVLLQAYLPMEDNKPRFGSVLVNLAE